MKTVKSSVYSATAIGISWVGDLLLITEPCFTERYAWQSQLLSNRDCDFISIYHAALTVNMSTPLWIKHLCECHYVDCFSCYNVLRLALRAVEDALEQRRPCTRTSATMSNFYSHTLKNGRSLEPCRCNISFTYRPTHYTKRRFILYFILFNKGLQQFW